MKLSIVIVTLCAAALSSGEAQYVNPIPINQQGNQFNLPGQPNYNYQSGVPLPAYVQQPGYQQPIFQQPGQVPNVPGVPINIQQLTQTGSALPPTNTQGFPNQQIYQSQTVPFLTQPNGIPINTVPQTTFPVNQQYIPQIGNFAGPGPVTFPG